MELKKYNIRLAQSLFLTSLVITALYLAKLIDVSEKTEQRPLFKVAKGALQLSRTKEIGSKTTVKADWTVKNKSLIFLHEGRTCSAKKHSSSNIKDFNQSVIEEFATHCEPKQLFPVGDINANKEMAYISNVLLSEYRKPSQGIFSQVTKCPRAPLKALFPVAHTGLVSFPGSGNTWTRHLVQQITGIQTGAIYYSKVLAEEGFPGEGKQKEVIAVKSHGVIYPQFKPYRQFEQQIVIIRNPFRSFPAEFKRGKLNLGHIKTGYIQANDTLWLSTCEDYMVQWQSFHYDVFSLNIPTLVVFYEDLKTCLLPELVRMAAFLRVKDLTQFSFCCALQRSTGNHYRNQSVNVDEIFSQVTKFRINSMLLKFYRKFEAKEPLLSKRILDYMTDT